MTGTAPPKLSAGPRSARNAWLAGLLFACAALVLYLSNPSTAIFYPQCYFHSLTGWECPGCGALRATHQLLHGHFHEAFRLNPLYVLALPVALLLLLTGRWRKFPFTRPWLWTAFAIILLFGVLRNLPWWPAR